MADRIQTGIADLDSLLGGGLLPGTLTVVMGATGIGKTQLGLAFANQGQNQEGERGVLFDLTARGDSQNHQDYANRIFNWELTEQPAGEKLLTDSLWNRDQTRKDSLHLFQYPQQCLLLPSHLALVRVYLQSSCISGIVAFLHPMHP